MKINIFTDRQPGPIMVAPEPSPPKKPVIISTHAHGFFTLHGRIFEYHIARAGGRSELGRMCWEDASCYAFDLGDGWRLPNYLDAKEMVRYGIWHAVFRKTRALNELSDGILTRWADIGSIGCPHYAGLLQRLWQGPNRPVVSFWTATTGKDSNYQALEMPMEKRRLQAKYKNQTAHVICIREL